MISVANDESFAGFRNPVGGLSQTNCQLLAVLLISQVYPKPYQAKAAVLRRPDSPAVPDICTNVVMIPACRQKQCALKAPLYDIESKHLVIELLGSMEIRNLKMDVADGGFAD